MRACCIVVGVIYNFASGIGCRCCGRLVGSLAASSRVFAAILAGKQNVLLRYGATLAGWLYVLEIDAKLLRCLDGGWRCFWPALLGFGIGIGWRGAKRLLAGVNAFDSLHYLWLGCLVLPLNAGSRLGFRSRLWRLLATWPVQFIG